MTRGNLILAGVLVAAAALWLLGLDWDKGERTGPVPRIFPDFGPDLADAIEITGGPEGTTWKISRPEASDWVLASAGGYPVKREEVDRFLDAVKNLRKDNLAGTSMDLRERTFTDDKNGRLVRVLRGKDPLAEFLVGKNPKSSYGDFFVRKATDDHIYRTHTLLTADHERARSENPDARGPAAFDWHDYTGSLSTKWIDPAIWDLGNAEVEEIWITRPGVYDAKVVRQAQDKWDLVEEGKDPVPADADVADGILSLVRRLTLYEVLGAYDDVKKEYGLEKPETTLLMKLRKKVEKPAPKEGEPAKEGEEKQEEYATFHRTIEIGQKVTRSRYDSNSDEMKPEVYYAIRVGLQKDIEDAVERQRAGYVFLVRDYTASQIRKDLADLAAKPKEGEEKGPGEEEGEKEEPPPVKPPDEKPGEEKPAEEKPADDAEKPGEGCGCGDKDEAPKDGG